jgi:hypothetical protein
MSPPDPLPSRECAAKWLQLAKADTASAAHPLVNQLRCAIQCHRGTGTSPPPLRPFPGPALCYNAGMLRNEYLALRRPYEPENIRLVIIAESPPASGLYFYKAGRTGEPLFAAMMKQLGLSPTTKEDGLRKFQQRGWVLVDATYEPINEFIGSRRDRIIDRDYPLLLDDLARLTPIA